MDFLFCSAPATLASLDSALQSAVPSRAIEHRHSGSWGAFVATGTPYWGLAPMSDEAGMICVVGDPLISGVRASQHKGSRRTEAIARRLSASDGTVPPVHPGAVVRISAGEAEITTDAWGAASLYWFCADDSLYVSSTPDLIAAVANVRLDRVAVRELLSATQLSFPNTLYSGVMQVPPGARIRLGKSGVKTVEYHWRPPLPEPDMSLDDARKRLDRAIGGAIEAVTRELGSNGEATLSAGMDSRYLVAKITKDGLAAVNTRTISPLRNQEFWIARRAAYLMGVKQTCTIPPAGSFGARMLDNPALVPSHIDHSSGHFASKALGEVEVPYLIGGYMADTILKFADPFFTARRHAEWIGRIANCAPPWWLSNLGASLSDRDQAEITERWIQSDAELGITENHDASLVTAFPATRQGHSAQFEAERRYYPMYEPFMTPDVLSLGFAIPASLKQETAKHEFYAPYLDGLLAGLMQPDAGEIITRRARKRLEKVSQQQWPAWLKNGSAWGSNWGDANRHYEAALTSAKAMVQEAIPGDYGHVPRQLCLQVSKASVLSRSANLN